MGLGKEIMDCKVPAGHITLWWLGQAGFIFKTPGGKVMVIDPYLTNVCKEGAAKAGFNMDRQVPTPIEPEEMAGFDAYVMTHSHGDHLDPATIERYRAAGGKGPYICPIDAVTMLRKIGIPEDQIQLTWPGKLHVIGDLEIRATFAIPNGDDDMNHTGMLIGIPGGPKFYVTGDTAYHEVMRFCVGPQKPDVLITVINPAFFNMSPIEAARLARDLNVKVVIPCHYDLFPDNSIPPKMLRTNMILEGIGDRYREIEHGVAYTYPEAR